MKRKRRKWQKNRGCCKAVIIDAEYGSDMEVGLGKKRQRKSDDDETESKINKLDNDYETKSKIKKSDDDETESEIKKSDDDETESEIEKSDDDDSRDDGGNDGYDDSDQSFHRLLDSI